MVNEDISTKIENAKRAYKNGNFVRAQEIFSTLSAENKNLDQVIYLQALTFFKLEEFSLAKAYFKKLINAEVAEFYKIQSYMLLGYLNTIEGDFDIAEEYLHELLKLNFENSKIYSILGFIYNKRKDFAQSEYYYKKALSIEPNNPSNHNNIGYNYLDWNTNFDLAHEHISRAIEIDKDNAAYVDSLGWFYFLKKKFSKALFFLGKAFRLRKDIIIEEHLKTVQKKRYEQGDS